MGKYMKKSKISGDVAALIMEAPPPHSNLGVRTRAKTLALQNSPQIPDPSAYLQLRSRRLLKLPPSTPEKPRRCAASDSNTISPVPQPELPKTPSSSFAEKLAPLEEDNVECSLGENFLDVEGRDERSTRESTPCSLIRDPNVIHTPGSTTRQKTRQTKKEHIRSSTPSDSELDEFFAHIEKQQQKMFMEKYNFDFVNEVPLPGRYEWVPVLH
ncbi:unnamed protein product [Sphenostylis stenocarpa]|uniref:Cyclin-dependent kinase inhibitor n=1 Tax=Sphenostylis stenocarpa TaxID=92480 RepID=A0AA86V8E7_9FABA|nr:unnamed protein product [Sphenostylis stenocarpa]